MEEKKQNDSYLLNDDELDTLGKFVRATYWHGFWMWEETSHIPHLEELWLLITEGTNTNATQRWAEVYTEEMIKRGRESELNF